MATDPKDVDIQVLEQGTVYFVFRPTVETHEPQGFEDVERFHMILRPRGQKMFRMAVIGRKRLPDLKGHEREWGFIEAIKRDAREVEEALVEHHQETKTRGERTYPATRPAAEGVYAFVQKGRNMHLAYELELPEKPGPVQKALNIATEGSFVISVKNPEKGGSPRGAGLSEEDKADYPKSKQKEFAGRKFAPTDPELLNYEGAEFVLIGADPDVCRDLDIDLPTREDNEKTAGVLRQLRMAKSRHPLEPLFEGKWA